MGVFLIKRHEEEEVKRWIIRSTDTKYISIKTQLQNAIDNGQAKPPSMVPHLNQGNFYRGFFVVKKPKVYLIVGPETINFQLSLLDSAPDGEINYALKMSLAFVIREQ